MHEKHLRYTLIRTGRQAGRTHFTSQIINELRKNRNLFMKRTFKWQIIFKPWNRDFMRGDRGWKIFEFGIFKFKEMPDYGQAISSYQYRGFIIRFSYWFPIDKV
jgi:hypothetical protein